MKKVATFSSFLHQLLSLTSQVWCHVAMHVVFTIACISKISKYLLQLTLIKKEYCPFYEAEWPNTLNVEV